MIVHVARVVDEDMMFFFTESINTHLFATVRTAIMFALPEGFAKLKLPLENSVDTLRHHLQGPHTNAQTIVVTMLVRIGTNSHPPPLDLRYRAVVLCPQLLLHPCSFAGNMLHDHLDSPCFHVLGVSHGVIAHRRRVDYIP